MAESALRAQVVSRLLAVSDSKLAASDINDAMSLRDDLGISSLILITLASELEDRLGINIGDEELVRIQTIGDLFETIESSQRRLGPA